MKEIFATAATNGAMLNGPATHPHHVSLTGLPRLAQRDVLAAEFLPKSRVAACSNLPYQAVTMTPLRQRMGEDMQIRNLSPPTQRASLSAVARFAQHFGKSPADLRPEQVWAYQLSLVKQQVNLSTLTTTVCALRFLYGITLGRDWHVAQIPYLAASALLASPLTNPCRQRTISAERQRYGAQAGRYLQHRCQRLQSPYGRR